jgi:hypothetical protein
MKDDSPPGALAAVDGVGPPILNDPSSFIDPIR